MDTLEKLNKLKDSDDFDEESREEFQNWIKTIEEAQELKELRKHYLIKRLLDKFKTEIAGIEDVLKKKRQLSELERLNLLDRVDLYNEFINLFNVDDRLHSIEQQVKNI